MFFFTLLSLISLEILVLIVLSSISSSSSSLLSGNTKVSSKLNDIVFDGIEGLNINIIAPFKINNYIIGFKYALTNVQKLPEVIFAKTTLNMIGGETIFETDYDFNNKIFNILSKWVNKKDGLSLTLKGDNRNYLPITEFGGSKEFMYDNKKINIDLIYNLPKKMWKGFSSIDFNNVKLEIDYNSFSKESILSVKKDLDNNNEIIPSISLLTGEINYIWLRKWNNGKLKSNFIPNKLVDLEWKDQGLYGNWITNIKIPLYNDIKPRLSLVREWSF